MGRRRKEQSTILGPSIILLFALEYGEKDALGVQRVSVRLVRRPIPIEYIRKVLAQLERKGFVQGVLRKGGDPDAARTRRYYRIHPTGTAALQEIRRIVDTTISGPELEP